MMIKNRKKLKIMLCLVLWTAVIFSACSKQKGIYIDIKKGAIVSCDGEGINEISIEDDSSELTLRSYQSIIYFNKKNHGLVAQTTSSDDVVDDFYFRLRSRCTYKIRKRMGYDRGSFSVTFKTDSLGNVIMASNTTCDN